jgi:hypothetical protein
MDLLSDILAPHGGRARFLSRYDHRGDWGIALAGATTAGLHYVESGSCWLRHADGDVALQQGDLVVVPLGAAHGLSHRRQSTLRPLRDFLDHPPVTDEPVVARVVCAARDIADDLRLRHPLLQELPPYIHIPGSEVQACPTLGPALRLLVQELRNPAPGR